MVGPGVMSLVCRIGITNDYKQRKDLIIQPAVFVSHAISIFNSEATESDEKMENFNQLKASRLVLSSPEYGKVWETML